jgi:hypothetical protein
MEACYNLDGFDEGFDWVTERAACTVNSVFESLYIEIKSDVELANGKRKQQFGVNRNGGVITVFQENSSPPRSVAFGISGVVIFAEDSRSRKRTEATLTLNDKGKCRLKVGDLERERWQFRKDALEDLFFGEWFN